MLTLTNEDCMDMMARYPDKYFDLAIVDPPYGINVNVSIGRRKGDAKSNYKKFAGEDKAIPDQNYFNELIRKSKNQIIWGGNYMIEYLTASPCWIMWDKGFSEDLTFAQIEMAWSSFKSSAKKVEISAASNTNRIHPTQKPVALYKWLLNKYANEGDLILDTHLGSGSIAIACHDYGYDLTGCELSEHYYQDAMKRIEQHTRQLQLGL